MTLILIETKALTLMGKNALKGVSDCDCLDAKLVSP